MNNKKTIEHKAVVKNINDKQIEVLINQPSACAGCHAKNVCSVSGIKEKLICINEVKGDFHVGEHVNLVLKRSLGLQAVLLSYIIPVILFISSLIIFNTFQSNELITASFSILMLLPYFSIIYFFKNKLKEHFIFTIQKS